MAVGRELRRIDKLGLLDEGEVLAEVELANLGMDPGALVVTDRQVLFLRTTLLRRKTRVVSIPLVEVTTLECASVRTLGREFGVLRLASKTPDQAARALEFDRIPGSESRVQEIARTIARQRDYLVR